MQSLKEHADKAMIEFERIVDCYHYSALGLKANPELLAHVEASLTIKPSESSDLDIDMYLDLIRDGKGRFTAGRLMDIDPRLIKKRLQFDQSFRELVELAEEEASEKIEAKLWVLAENSERWAMELWLKKRNKNRWGEDTTVIKHEGTIVQELSAAPLVDQILAMQALLDSRVQQQKALTDGIVDDIIDVESEEI